MIDGRAVTLQDIYAARGRLREHLLPTPLRESAWLSGVADARTLLKLESVQLTNSFKIRGAMNAAVRLAQTARPPAIVTASAGNHGRAIALAAERFGLTAVVFTPANAPAIKKAAIRRHGAVLRDEPSDYDTAERLAREFASREDAIFISAYNHPDVIAGAGTIALEILEAMPDVETIVVPVGGGGLASGVGVAIKSAAPHVTVVGVEVTASRPFAVGLARGAITRIDVSPSLADGLVGNLEPGSMTFDIVRQRVDALVSAGEEDLRRAIRGLAAEDHVIAEGAGAAATAAVLSGHAVRPGQRAVVVVSGSNIDLGLLSEILSER
ncbi:MAG TPA: pyridoxal-phosphate dependent enzyme [Vicinamibacterales bacterium]|nr:pyridoxal-phosphate dependent enzyme [Vicinamibacterales bacterium]